jgi:integrase
VRIVPCHPRLVRLLRTHLDEFATGPRGHLFRGARGGPLPDSTYTTIWAHARGAVLGNDPTTAAMAVRPYDLRHACLTTWLNATSDPARVAAWAGHSLDVLLRVYTGCITGRDDQAKQRIERALAALA